MTRAAVRRHFLQTPQRSPLISWLPAQPIRSWWRPGAASWPTNQKSPSGQVRFCSFSFYFRLVNFRSFSDPAFVSSSAPAAASLLSLSSSSSAGLFLSWTPPAGLWESYRLFLFDGSQQLVNTTLDRAAVNYSFPGTRLTPGRLYRAVLRVESGGLTAESSCDGATGRITAEIYHDKTAETWETAK